MSEAFFQNFIDLPLWDRAQWQAVLFVLDLTGHRVPVMGLLFTDGEAGQEIFKGWIGRLGEVDKSEELRIAIVEGEIPGEPPGYTVTISSNPQPAIAKAMQSGQSFDPSIVFLGTRWCRMAPPDSPNLLAFKEAYRNKGAYMLIPASPPREQPTPHLHLGIIKSRIHFRNVADLDESDPDSIILVGSKKDD